MNRYEQTKNKHRQLSAFLKSQTKQIYSGTIKEHFRNDFFHVQIFAKGVTSKL